MKYLILRFAILFVFLFSCNKVQDEQHDLLHRKSTPSKKVYVSNLTGLYNVVKDSTNDGATLVLAAGTYLLSPTYPNAAPAPNKGQLDLLKDMSLVEMPGHPEGVIIDVSALPRSSVEIQSTLGLNFRTGAIRAGNSTNTIESMTLQSNGKNEDIPSLVQSDNVATGVARIRVSHTNPAFLSTPHSTANVEERLLRNKMPLIYNRNAKT